MSSALSPRTARALVGLLLLAAGTRGSYAEPQAGVEGQTGGIGRTESTLMWNQLQDDQNDRIAPATKEAIDAYHLGIKYLAKGAKLEEEAAATDGTRAARKAEKAQQRYRKAIRHLRRAIDARPDFYQALTGLGLALLEIERYDEALDAYDRALALGPAYPETIEERGEVYLGLDRLQEAQEAYLQLVPVDRVGAADLMAAMRRWLELRSTNAGGLPEETIEGFAAWIDENELPGTSVPGRNDP